MGYILVYRQNERNLSICCSSNASVKFQKEQASRSPQVFLDSVTILQQRDEVLDIGGSAPVSPLDNQVKVSGGYSMPVVVQGICQG